MRRPPPRWLPAEAPATSPAHPTPTVAPGLLQGRTSIDNVTDVINKIRQLDGHLHSALQRVGDVALADLEFMATATTAEIADRAKVSEPTLIRFCRMLGCEGVRDFKLKLAQNLAVGLQYLRPTQGGDDNIAGILERVLANGTEVFRLLGMQLDQEAVARAAEVITSAHKLDIYGVGGGSSALAQEAQNRLFRLREACTAHTDSYMQRMSASTLEPGDAVLASSATGLPRELRDSLQIAREYGARTLCLSRSRSPLALIADIAITLEIPESSDVYKPSAVRLGRLCALDVLAPAVAQIRGDTAMESLRRIRFTMSALHGDTREGPIGD